MKRGGAESAEDTRTESLRPRRLSVLIFVVVVGRWSESRGLQHDGMWQSVMFGRVRHETRRRRERGGCADRISASSAPQRFYLSPQTSITLECSPHGSQSDASDDQKVNYPFKTQRVTDASGSSGLVHYLRAAQGARSKGSLARPRAVPSPAP